MMFTHGSTFDALTREKAELYLRKAYIIMRALQALGQDEVILSQNAWHDPDNSSLYRYLTAADGVVSQGKVPEVFRVDFLSLTDMLLEILLGFDPRTNREKVTLEAIRGALAQPNKR